MARKILLADDSVTAQNMGRKILADAGYEVIAVNNGSAALKKIAELKPEVVILDVYMPGYSGLEVCQRLKESQDTARIPVLLTVGKLEPFKPEEAQRVRAEGYIVKPFEASELLSALSKLEDKIVPRSEPSKPGRFARAMAAVDESSRNRSEASTSENGWKNRIAFPHQKTEAEQKEEEKLESQPSTYNPVNRDLRTMVENSEEKAEAQKKDKEEDRLPATSVDITALAPAGLPSDVTAEELAAITAAAAQIQMGGAIREDAQAGEHGPNQVAAAEPAEPEVKYGRRKTDKLSAENSTETAQDEPVTMAVAVVSAATSSSGGSSWKAVSVDLDSAESALSLEDEMRKAHAAFAATDVDAAESIPQTATAEANFSASPDVPGEIPAAISNSEAANANSEPESAPAEAAFVSAASTSQPQPVSPLAMQSEAPPATSSFAGAEEINPYENISASDESISANAPVESAQLEPAQAAAAEFEPSPHPSSVSTNAELDALSQETTSSVVDSRDFADSNTAEAETPVPASWRLPEVQAAGVETESPSNPNFEPASQAHQPEPPPQFDSEAVKSTAAAWASWRQVRDTGKNNHEEINPQPQQFDTTASVASASVESLPEDTQAKAVAAGAEQFLQAAADDSSRNPADVASIVDSVLADLRPKLMEEISRKMAQKK